MKKLFTLLMTLWLAIGSLFAVNLKGGEVLYLTPNENWIKDNARFAIYLCNGSSGEKWVSMTKVTGETNLYSVTVPTGDYKNLIFVRLNPANTTNNWSNKWNQTGDLSYDGKNNCCSINSGQWNCGMNVKWSFYSTEPVITVVTSPEFPATTIEETATATLKYTVDNSEDKATITIDNDAFTAVDNNGTVTITFAPTEAKEYTATITIAVGEVKETVEISATGLAKDVVKEPEVLNLTAPEFAEIIEGNTTTAVATYELLNADEAEAKVEGEGFEITEQELGKVTIKFAPTKAGEYAGTLFILVAGETLKQVAFTATAKPAPYYAIRGDMTDWSDKKDVKLTPNDDKSEYFIKGFEIASGKKFKVVYVNEDNATTWYGTDKVQLEAGISNSGQGDGDIALTPAGKYDIYYKVKEGKIWIQKYVAPEEPEKPELNVSAEEVVFEELTLGEEPVSATETIKYEIKNSDEAAVIELESDVFKAEDENGTITITFAPEAEGEYTAELTITLGEIVKTIAISGSAKAAVVPDPEPDPDPTPEYPKTITVKVACAWETCNIWAWYADESGNVYTEWPGEAMTKGEDGFYAIEMSIESPVYFKVNAGLGKTESENYMTELSESTCFNMDGLTLVVNEDCEYEEPVKIVPYYGIRGITGSWEMADDIKLTEDADKAEWYITNIEVDGTQEFKVVYVDETGAATWYGAGAVEANESLGEFGEGDENIKLAAGKYDIYFKVNEGRMWIQKYVAPEEPEKPELNVSAEEVVFEELTLGEEPVSATETIKYEIKNSDEAAVIELESDVFKAEDENGTITITFAPEAEGEYTAELTITLGEIVKTIAISGSAKAAVDPEPEKPELIVSTEELVFETLILDGEQFSSTETITYEIKNSDEAAVIALESEDDVFEAIDEDGTITITFTPIFNNYLYKAELTITLGDIVKTVAISAVVKPLIDDILLPEFDDTKVGEYDEIEVLYSLHKGNEGVARIEGDPAFEITSQEVGRMFIKFTPLEVKEYTATLIITSGKFEREITLIANGIAPDPEPTDITFTVQVPEGTKECWIAGTPGWTFIQMEKVDGEENLFSITVEKTVLNGEQWKYASGANWQYAEVIEGNGNRTEAEDPYDVVTAWQKLYDPDFQPIDPYYAIRGLNGDASWTGSGDIKLEESADASEWVALGFTVAEGESFKVIYIDENAKVSGYYAGLEDGCDVGQSYDDMGNLVLPAGTYNLYFKPDTELMWISKVDTPTDAEEAIAELIYAVDGTIIAPAPFAIIDLAGKDVTKANGSLQGTYIVKTLNSTAKISVK